MRWIRAYFRAIRALAKGPEGATFEEVGDWARRRALARLLMLPLTVPMVLGAVFGWPAVKEWRHQAQAPCAALLSADDVRSHSGRSAEPGPVDVGMYGCTMEWMAGDESVLTVRVLKPGGTIVYGVARRFKDAGRQPPGPWVERWDWGRDESVRVLHDERFVAVAEIPAGSSSGPSVVLASSTDPSPLVVRALEHRDAIEDYVGWLD